MSWGELLLVFLRAAFLSVNGSTTLALLQQDLVYRLHVLTPREFNSGVAIGSATPGPLGYGCIALGFLADGWRGAFVAVFTSWLPALLAVPLRAGYRRLESRPWVGGLSWGVSAAGIGLLVLMLWNVGATAIVGWPEAVVCAVVMGLLVLRVPAAAALAAAAVAGALLLG